MLKRPKIIIKFAQSKDGFMGQENKNIWLTNPFSKRLVHKWRSEIDGILAGTGTVLTDNPRLNTRFGFKKSPTRIVLDSRLIIGTEFNIFNNEAKTIVFTKNNNITGIDHQKVKYIVLNSWTLEELLMELYHEKVKSLIVEGGQKILNSFIKKGLWDEARVFTGDKKIGFGLKAPVFDSKSVETYRILSDTLEIFHNKNLIR